MNNSPTLHAVLFLQKLEFLISNIHIFFQMTESTAQVRHILEQADVSVLI